MEITINLTETAPALAHNALLEEVSNPLSEDFITEEELYNFDEDGNATYKEVYQSIFDRWYFFDVIQNHKRW